MSPITSRHGGHIGIPKQLKGGHVGVPNLNSFLHVNVAYMLAALVKTLLRLLLKVKC